jgi:hypothetical protein
MDGGGGGLDTFLILATPLGTAAAFNDDDPDGTLGGGSRIRFTATETGVYVIEATTNLLGDIGAYTLGVTIS